MILKKYHSSLVTTPELVIGIITFRLLTQLYGTDFTGCWWNGGGGGLRGVKLLVLEGGDDGRVCEDEVTEDSRRYG